jgi:glycine cleavage system H protein
VADIYSPISGKVLEVNESLKKTPEVINQSPEQEGWIAKFLITNPDELSSLLSKKQYEEFCAGH